MSLKIASFSLTPEQRNDLHTELIANGIASAVISIGYNLLSDNEKKKKAIFETIITVTGISMINQMVKYMLNPDEK